MDCFTIELVSNASLIVIRIIVLAPFQIFYGKKYILEENEKLQFQKSCILHCTKTLLREKLLRKNEKFNRCILNLNCTQVLLI